MNHQKKVRRRSRPEQHMCPAFVTTAQPLQTKKILPFPFPRPSSSQASLAVFSSPPDNEKANNGPCAWNSPLLTLFAEAPGFLGCWGPFLLSYNFEFWRPDRPRDFPRKEGSWYGFISLPPFPLALLRTVHTHRARSRSKRRRKGLEKVLKLRQFRWCAPRLLLSPRPLPSRTYSALRSLPPCTKIGFRKLVDQDGGGRSEVGHSLPST